MPQEEGQIVTKLQIIWEERLTFSDDKIASAVGSGGQLGQRSFRQMRHLFHSNLLWTTSVEESDCGPLMWNTCLTDIGQCAEEATAASAQTYLEMAIIVAFKY